MSQKTSSSRNARRHAPRLKMRNRRADGPPVTSGTPAPSSTALISALRQGFVPCLEHGLEKVVQDGLLPRQDLHLRDHARHDRVLAAVRLQRGVLRLNDDRVEGLA